MSLSVLHPPLIGLLVMGYVKLLALRQDLLNSRVEFNSSLWRDLPKPELHAEIVQEDGSVVHALEPLERAPGSDVQGQEGFQKSICSG